jgi:hypothetical protein
VNDMGNMRSAPLTRTGKPHAATLAAPCVQTIRSSASLGLGDLPSMIEDALFPGANQIATALHVRNERRRQVQSLVNRVQSRRKPGLVWVKCGRAATCRRRS